MQEEVRAAGGVRALGGGEASGICTGRKGPTQGWGGQGTRGAHDCEHKAHIRDLGRVEVERLVERRRPLPSRKAGMQMREEVRAGRREGAGWRRRKRHLHGEGPTQGWGARARVERTRNMLFMFVTLDVSKVSGWLNAFAFYRVERRA